MRTQQALRYGRIGALVLGEHLPARTRFEVFDKFSGEVIAEVADCREEDVRAALDAVADPGPFPPAQRQAVLTRLAQLIEQERDELAACLTAEAGFTSGDSHNEVDRAIVTLTLCASEAVTLTGRTVSMAGAPGQEGRFGFTVRVPVGVVAAVTPFNSPLNTVLHKIAPALAAGNSVVLKPSEFTPITASKIGELLLRAGLPIDRLAVLHGRGEVVGLLLADQRVRFVAFTGSTRVGQIIASAAGIRRVQLELGSIASTIVCRDADLRMAVSKIARAAFRKAGQVCTSPQRLYVHSGVLHDFMVLLKQELEGYAAGDPRDPATVVGPLISASAAERVRSSIAEAVAGGAALAIGGMGEASVVLPTVLIDPQPDSTVMTEEIFGPVVSVVPFDEIEAAIDGANATPFGLAAGVFTSDIASALTFAERLQFGNVYINEASSARIDIQPFAGVKSSGYGAEGPHEAVRQMTDERFVSIRP